MYRIQTKQNYQYNSEISVGETKNHLCMRSTNVLSADSRWSCLTSNLLRYKMLQQPDEGGSGLRCGVEVDLGEGNALGGAAALPRRPRASLSRRPSNDINGEM